MQIGNLFVSRIPWVWPYNPRSTSFDQMPRRVNVMLEKAGERIFAQRRPGLQEFQTTAAGQGQGLAFYNGSTYAVIDDTLYTTAIGDSGSTGATWTNAGTADWKARQLFQTVSLNNVIYLMGGIPTGGGTSFDDVWTITPGQGWKVATAAAPWGKRYGLMAGYIGDTVYVIGGQDASSGDIYGDVWASADGVEWEQKTASMDTGTVAFGQAISADNGIYVFCGQDDSSTMLDRVVFSSDGITWKLVNDAPGWSVRKFPSVWYYQNKLWLGGGEDQAGTTTYNDVWSSDDGGRTWTQATATAWVTGLSKAGYTVYADKMWQINGWDGSAGTNRVYSSTDGITWTVVTASGPFAASSGGNVINFATLTAVSQYHYETMYWLGGVDSPATTTNNNVYRADLDTTISTTTAIPGVGIVGQSYQFASFVEGTKLLLKNESGMWVLDGGDIIQITDAGLPPETVPGIVVLGGFAYVMDPSGLIRNCDIDDPYHWPMLNAIAADYEDDQGVALVKYLNYAVAFGQYTMQFFYDAGSPQGSPLRPYLAGNMALGCADANSIVPIGQTVAWVSRTREGRRQVHVFNGLTPQPISTWAVEKLIQNWLTLYGYAVSVPGHQFYVLWTDDAKPALAYDFASGEWTEFTNYASTNLPLSMIASSSTLEPPFGSIALDATSGIIYSFSSDIYDDEGNAFPVMLITDKVDNQNNRSKFWGQFEVIGDMNTGTPSISWSDDDFQTFSTARTVDMSTQRPVLYRNGASRRRIFKYLQQDSNALRVESLEQTVEQGQ